MSNKQILVFLIVLIFIVLTSLFYLLNTNIVNIPVNKSQQSPCLMLQLTSCRIGLQPVSNTDIMQQSVSQSNQQTLSSNTSASNYKNTGLNQGTPAPPIPNNEYFLSAQPPIISSPSTGVPSPTDPNNVFFDMYYFPIHVNDLHGKFTFPDFSKLNCESTVNVNCFLSLQPFNLDIGDTNEYTWFQFGVSGFANCAIGCPSMILEIWNNQPPPPNVGVKPSTYADIGQPTPYTNGLPIGVDNIYEFDFYPDPNKSNYMVLKITCDTCSGLVWWNEWQVPDINVVSDEFDYSPAFVTEIHTQSSTTISGAPTFQLIENIGTKGNIIRTSSMPNGICSSVSTNGIMNSITWNVNPC